MEPSLPEDILLLIFEQLVRVEDTEDKWPALVYNRRVAQAPFIVAAICRRWRELALATSILWTYFGFPKAVSMNERDLLRLELLRSRVRNAPIDVVFGWDHRHEADVCTGGTSILLFDALLELHLQWKSVVLHVVGSVDCDWTTDQVFECLHWPLLESLSLAIDDKLGVIPAAPRMRRMWLDCERKSVEKPFIVGSYPALTMIGIYCDSSPALRSLALALRGQLVELALIDDCDDYVAEVGPEATRIVFPVLQCLTLDDVCWLRHIDAPALRKLLLTNRHMPSMEVETMRRFEHVQDLQPCGEFSTRQLAVLTHLSNIKTLTFDCPPLLMTAFKNRQELRQINSGALCNVASLDAPVWPHLERLYFGAAGWPTSSSYSGRGFNAFISDRGHNEDPAQDIIDFVSARNLRAASTDEPAVARIVQVVINHPGAPEWLEGKLQELVVD